MQDQTLFKQLRDFPNFSWFKENYPQIDTVLFDMDGTIVNTEFLHAHALAKVLDQLKIEIDPDYLEKHYFGLSDLQVYQGLKVNKIKLEEFIHLKNQYFIQELKETSPNSYAPTPMRDFLEDLSFHGYKMALVTNSEPETTHAILDALSYKKYFSQIVTCKDTHSPKPHPAPYLLGLSLLNSQKERCLIFEDSPAGLQSALSTGSYVVQLFWTQHPM